MSMPGQGRAMAATHEKEREQKESRVGDMRGEGRRAKIGRGHGPSQPVAGLWTALTRVGSTEYCHVHRRVSYPVF